MVAFVLIILSVVAVGFALWPLMVQSASSVLTVSHEDTPLGRLGLQKELVLTNLGDLDFEYSMGKLVESDYEQFRASLKRQAGHVLEQIEVLKGEHVVQPQSKTPPRTTPASSFCAQCGNSLPSAAKFCPGCGSKVVTA